MKLVKLIASGVVGSRGTILPQNLLTRPDVPLETFEVAEDWTAGAGSTVAANATQYKTGTQAVKLTSPAAGTGQMTKTIALSGVGAYEFFEFWVYLHNLSTTSTYRLSLSSTEDFSKSFSYTVGGDGYGKRDGWLLYRVPLTSMTNTGGESWDNPMIRLRFEVTASSGAVSATFDALAAGYKRVPVIMLSHDGPYNPLYLNGAFDHMKALGIRGDMYVSVSKLKYPAANEMTTEQVRDLYNAGWDICTYGYGSIGTAKGMGDMTQAEQEFWSGNGAIYVRETAQMPGYERHFAYTGAGTYWSNSYSDAALAATGMLTGRGGYGSVGRAAYYPPGNFLNMEMQSVNGMSLVAAKAKIDTIIERGQFWSLNFDSLDDTDRWTTEDYNALMDYIYAKWRSGLVYPITINEFYRLSLGPVRIPEAPSTRQTASAWTPPTEMFSITHDAGNLNEYNLTYTDSGNLSAAAAAALNGSANGLRVNCPTTANSKYGVKQVAMLTDNDTRATFYLDPNSITLGAANISVWGLYEGRTGYALARVLLKNATGYKLYLRVIDDTAAYVNGSEISITDAPHQIEVHTKRATANGVADGWCKLWIDGTLVSTVSAIANYAQFVKCDQMELGAISGVTAEVNGAFYLDDLTARRDERPASSLLFNVRHETGDLSEYNSSSTNGGRLSVTTAAKLNGAYGLNCLLQNTTAMYGSKTVASSTGKLRARFYIDPNTLTMATNDEIMVFNPRSAAAGIGGVFLNKGASGYGIRASIVNDTGSNQYSASTVITDEPHYVEYYLQRATSSTASDGQAELWIDGVLSGTITAVDNYDKFDALAAVRLGAVFFQTGAPTGTYYLDELAVNDDGAVIGPIA